MITQAAINYLKVIITTTKVTTIAIDNPVKQSKLEQNAYNWHKAQENVYKWVTTVVVLLLIGLLAITFQQ